MAWKAKKCKHCGNHIDRASYSSTGWTHVGSWEGIRCQGGITGATPKD